MSKLFQKVKERITNVTTAPPAAQQIIELPIDQKFVVCKNHFTISPKGNKAIIRTVITFMDKETERTCECGILYRRSLK